MVAGAVVGLGGPPTQEPPWPPPLLLLLDVAPLLDAAVVPPVELPSPPAPALPVEPEEVVALPLEALAPWLSPALLEPDLELQAAAVTAAEASAARIGARRFIPSLSVHPRARTNPEAQEPREAVARTRPSAGRGMSASERSR
jgi:hypothetical protein